MKTLNKRKYVFTGDLHSLNIEIICKSFYELKEKVSYILIGSTNEIKRYINKINYEIEINDVLNPYEFDNLNKNKLNIFNLDLNRKNYENLIAQIHFANQLSNSTGYDLVTMAIDKSVFKKKMEFVGLTEYLAKINKKKTFMLMKGENFSIIPLTTHINPKEIYKQVSKKKLSTCSVNIRDILTKKNYKEYFSTYVFLCYNPHCGENGLLGNEEKIIEKSFVMDDIFLSLKPADSAFKNFQKNTLFFSMYHDQALIPFKVLNKKTINMTIGLDYKRLSPTHGTGKDLLFKNAADNNSYLECMKI